MAIDETKRYYSVREAEDAIKAEGYTRNNAMSVWTKTGQPSLKVKRDDPPTDAKKFYISSKP